MTWQPAQLRRLLIAITLLVVAAVAVVLVARSRGEPEPPSRLRPTPPLSEVVAPTVGPMTTGHLLPPGSAGASPILSADTVPLARPEFRTTGPEPWQIHRAPRDGMELEGYTSRPSYLPGETLRVAVNTTAPTFNVTIWRVSGTMPVAGPFEKVAELADLPGRRQPPPVVDPVTKSVAAAWTDDVVFQIPAGWPSDVYLVRLDSSEGVQRYVPFVVRSPVPHQLVVVASVMNWQAYNDWGGSSLYSTTIGEPLPGVTRALGVSLDRPYRQDDGAGQLFFLELPFDAWALRQGLDVAFTTDYDLSLNPDAGPMPRVLVFNGHDEYWGPKLYLWLDRHINRLGDLGVALLAADTGYWPVDLADPTADGPRLLIVLKNGPVPPELAGPATSTGPSASDGAADVAGPSDAGTAAPSASIDTEERATLVLGNIPESGPIVGSFPTQPLFGVQYAGITSALGRYRIGPAVPPAFVGSTGLRDGDSIGFIAGGEVDGVSSDPLLVGPDGGRYDHVFASAAAIPGKTPTQVATAQAVWRDVPGGGRVFSAGTFYWGWALDPVWAAEHEVAGGFPALTLSILQWLGRP